MRILLLLITSYLLFSAPCYAVASSWYENGTRSPTIEIFFEKDSVNLKPYYRHHIKTLALGVLKNSNLKLVITHKDDSVFSKIRAKRLKDYLIFNFRVPSERIVLLSGLASAYDSKSGEKVILFTSGLSIKKRLSKKKKKSVRVPASKSNKNPKVLRKRYQKPGYEYGRPPKYVYIKRSPKLRETLFEVSLALADHSFSNTKEDLSSMQLGFYGQKRLTNVLSATGNFTYGFTDSTLAESREYLYALGLLSEFKDFNLNAKLYSRNTWAWVASDSKFVTVTDMGLHQGLDLDCVKTELYTLNIGVWAELSFSNTIPGLESTNVLSFGTEIIFEWLEPNVFVSLFTSRRKYKVFDASINGLNLGYRF